MKVNREIVLAYLKELEERNGGYYGTDLMNISEKLGITIQILKRRLTRWIREDMSFKGLHYLGQHMLSITLNMFKTI